MGRRGRRRKQLLDDLEKTRYHKNLFLLPTLMQNSFIH